MFIVPGFPEGYDWQEHDRKRLLARRQLESRRRQLREQIPAIQRLAVSGVMLTQVDQALVREVMQILLSETVIDMHEEQELAVRHGNAAPPSPPPSEPGGDTPPA